MITANSLMLEFALLLDKFLKGSFNCLVGFFIIGEFIVLNSGFGLGDVALCCAGG
jgi:hypothetical protein